MGKECSLKEAFIESKLDEYQPDWKKGKNILAETKEKIKNYILGKYPDDDIGAIECLSNYTIVHMARKIRERKNLTNPTTSKNKRSVRSSSSIDLKNDLKINKKQEDNKNQEFIKDKSFDNTEMYKEIYKFIEEIKNRDSKNWNILIDEAVYNIKINTKNEV